MLHLKIDAMSMHTVKSIKTLEVKIDPDSRIDTAIYFWRFQKKLVRCYVDFSVDTGYTMYNVQPI